MYNELKRPEQLQSKKPITRGITDLTRYQAQLADVASSSDATSLELQARKDQNAPLQNDLTLQQVKQNENREQSKSQTEALMSAAQTYLQENSKELSQKAQNRGFSFPQYCEKFLRYVKEHASHFWLDRGTNLRVRTLGGMNPPDEKATSSNNAEGSKQGEGSKPKKGKEKEKQQAPAPIERQPDTEDSSIQQLRAQQQQLANTQRNIGSSYARTDKGTRIDFRDLAIEEDSGHPTVLSYQTNLFSQEMTINDVPKILYKPEERKQPDRGKSASKSSKAWTGEGSQKRGEKKAAIETFHQAVNVSKGNRPLTQFIFLTGASGTMGSRGLKELSKDSDNWVVTLVLPTEKDRKVMKPYENHPRVHIYWGDLTNYEDVKTCVDGADIILHVGGLVSPAANDHPRLAMEVNYGSTMNILRAVKEQPDPDQIKLVYIGTVAQTGDRMPPIHWGRVGDPIKPSVHDYYTVSKVAAERAVIESGPKYWVSLRQTGILSPTMVKIQDGIIFHQGLKNALEYVTDKDSGVLLRNICRPDLPPDFWGHIYNIGGGTACRISCHDLFKGLFKRIGITNLDDVLEGNWFATRNFHGQYYLDSEKLNKYLNFQSKEGLEYFYACYLKHLGPRATLAKILTKLPSGRKLVGSAMKRRFFKLAMGERGTMNFITRKRSDFIDPFFISEEAWRKIPSRISEMDHFTDWDNVVHIDHGYDESIPESDLTIDALKGAAIFRGGECLSDSMAKGDMRTKLTFKCAFGHEFEASPRLVLEGGHWCLQCEHESWNYHEIAKVNPFFAQVWYPLHAENEPPRVYKKIISKLVVEAH